MIMRLSINDCVVGMWMGWTLMSSGSNFFASSGQATRLLSPHHDDPLAPPRVPDHRVDWTQGRSPSIPGQQGPQWAPRPPQRQRRSQHQVSPPSVSVSSPVLQLKAFLLLQTILGSFLFSLVCACQFLLSFLLPGWLSESYLRIILCLGQNVCRTR